MASLLDRAEAVLAGAARCFAITRGIGGEVHARIVEPFAREPGWVFWTLTSARSRKVSELRCSGHLTLAYQLGDGDAYLALVGVAEVIQDTAEARSRWREGWRRYFAGGPDDPDIALVRFRAGGIELYDAIRDRQPQPDGLRPVMLARAGEEWNVAQM